jgi:hypothetical protein
MTVWSLTKSEITDGIEVLIRRLSGRETLTYLEKKILDNALNAAMQDLCLDRGISRWRFIQTSDTEDTTANTAYIDLDENIFNVINGTVRIEAENITLSPMSLEYNYSSDPDQNDTGMPQLYCLDSSGDAETMRMRLKPTPDAVFTISFVGESVPDKDSISSFPAWTHACLKDKATENALRDLGFFNESVPFARSYEKRKQDNKASQGTDTPIHINRVGYVSSGRGIQSRLPD